MKLENLTAVATGASRGIGKAIAKAVAAEGARVALVARTVDGLETTKREIREIGGEAEVFATDLRREEDINRLADSVKREWGGADIVVNAAGVWHGPGEDNAYYGPTLEGTPVAQINELIDVHVRAPMLLTRLLLPEMIEKKRGKVLNISGTFLTGARKWLHYYVTKKALESFTVGLADEMQIYQIQVNCISPSDTASVSYLKHYSDDPEWVAKILKPEDVARLSVFLLSEEGDNITGQIIVIRSKADTEQYVLAQ